MDRVVSSWGVWDGVQCSMLNDELFKVNEELTSVYTGLDDLITRRKP